MSELSLRSRVLVTLAAAVVLLGSALVYAVVGRDPDPAVAAHGTVTLDPGDRLLLVTQQHLATVPLDDPAGPKTVSDVSCVRVYAASGTGICVRQDSPWTYSATES